MSGSGEQPINRLVDRKVDAGFAGVPREEQVEYLRDLRASWREAEVGVTRRLLLLLLLGGLGTLSLAGGIGDMTVAGVQIDDRTLVPAVVPVLIAYVLYELAVAIAAIDLYGEAHDALMRRLYPTMWEQRLHDLVTPATSIVWASPGAAWFEDVGRLPSPVSTNLSGVVWVGRTLAALGLPPVFLAAYYSQLLREGLSGAVLVSLLASVLLVAAAVANIVGWVRRR